jgi:hypothetical protein
VKESQIQAAIRVALGKLPDVRLWRNHVGAVQAIDGTTHRFGLAVGSADLVGILAPSGRMIALECKSETGRLRPEQRAWLQLVRDAGGFAAVVRSAEEALAAVERARNGAVE